MARFSQFSIITIRQPIPRDESHKIPDKAASEGSQFLSKYLMKFTALAIPRDESHKIPYEGYGGGVAVFVKIRHEIYCGSTDSAFRANKVNA